MDLQELPHNPVQPHIPRWAKFGLAGITGASLAFALSDYQAPEGKAIAHAVQKVTVIHTTPEQGDDAFNPCLVPFVESKGGQKLCSEMRLGRVAIVDFGQHGSSLHYNAEQVAALAAQRLKQESQGMIDIKPVVIPASPVAQSMLDKLEDAHKAKDQQDCVDTQKDKQMSEIAESTMPELKQYAVVEAMGALSCAIKEAHGVESITGGQTYVEGRMVDIYDVRYAAGNQNRVMAGITEHETGHVFGLDHAGTMDCDTYESRTGSAVDVAELFNPKACTYDEYGNTGNIMANTWNSKTGAQFNDMQLDYLGQMEGRSALVRGTALQPDHSVLLDSRGKAPSYANMALPKGTAFGKDWPEFTNLVFLNDSVDGKARISLYLTTSSNEYMFRTVMLGDRALRPSGKKFVIGDEAIEVIPAGGTQLTVSLLSAMK